MSAAQGEIDKLVSDSNQPSNDDLTNNTLPDLEIVSRTFVPTIRHVLVKARLRWSKFIKEIWRKCYTFPTDIENWRNIFASSHRILRAASLGGRKHKFQNEKLINERIARWENVDRGNLWNKATLSKAAKKARKTSSQNENKILERAYLE